MVKWVRLVVINDNEPNPPLLSDWGWSVYVETERWSILYDADTEPRVIENNAASLGIDLSKVNVAFLSHYHADHYGGFKYVGEVKRGLMVYVPEDDEVLRGWGLTPITTVKPTEILRDAGTTGVMRGMGVNEHALAIRLNNHGMVLIVGCSHPGIDNIARRVHELYGEVYLVIGGFHNPSKHQLDITANYSRYVCPAHCSGREARQYVASRYPDKYCEVKTGTRLNLPLI
ncbi:MAG: MBL fold metallo-hydrolase [Caldivirga sp.]|uniref:MBL fold metallo-hydrolase n=1 Tax=Caldivirga sp. MU80 TaxID=1650354 RepID=UPI000833D24C|nr:MBL fold metallo-hydrolase [Caldivirga sp. MU80]NAZ27712.1 MBL fold metallo-hydrolase [Caldivirga sp.]